MRRWRRSLPTRVLERWRQTSRARGMGRARPLRTRRKAASGGEGEACGTSAILVALLHTEPQAKPIESTWFARRSARDRRVGCRRPSLRSLRSPDRLACAILGGACLGIGRDSSRSLG